MLYGSTRRMTGALALAAIAAVLIVGGLACSEASALEVTYYYLPG